MEHFHAYQRDVIPETVETMYFGRCYKTCDGNLSRLMLIVQMRHLMMYLHEPGDEMWLSGGIIPNSMVPVEMYITNETMAVELTLAQKQTTYLSTKVSPCNNLPSAKTDYYKCIQDNFCAKASALMNCSLPGFKPFLGQSCSMPECLSAKDGAVSYGFFFRTVNMNQLKDIRSLCIQPCFEMGYGFNLRKLHLNSMVDETDSLDTYFWGSHYMLDIFFSSDLIEERTETLIYDTASFWSSVGGNLCLFLGFSCLTVGISILELFKKLGF